MEPEIKEVTVKQVTAPAACMHMQYAADSIT